MAHNTGIAAQHLTFGSLFRIFYWSGVALWIVLGTIMSVGALAGFETVFWNNRPVTGVPGLLTGIGISTAMGLMLSAVTALMSALIVKLLGGLLPLKNLRTTQSTAPIDTTIFGDS